MLSGLPVALIFLAQAATAPDQAEAKPPVQTTADPCSPRTPEANAREIVICAERPNGYRIDPDVLAARRAKKQALAGRPKPPNKMKDTSCTVVGPAPCMDQPMINLIGAALTAAEMAARLSRGQEIGSMFVTDPQPNEYQLYQQAKAEREAEEASKAAKAKANEAAKTPPPETPGN
jgi:hypothetical protein